MTVEHERARFYITIPDDDPRFRLMREVLDGVQQQGRKSPASRMLAEWALIGFGFQMGLVGLQGDTAMTSGASSGTSAPVLPADLPDPRTFLEQKREIEESMAEFGFD